MAKNINVKELKIDIAGECRLEDLIFTPLSPTDVIELIGYYRDEAERFKEHRSRHAFCVQRADFLQGVLDEWARRRNEHDNGKPQLH